MRASLPEGGGCKSVTIAIFASAFYPHVGGVEELCRQLALELRRRGHRAIILTNR